MLLIIPNTSASRPSGAAVSRPVTELASHTSGRTRSNTNVMASIASGIKDAPGVTAGMKPSGFASVAPAAYANAAAAKLSGSAAYGASAACLRTPRSPVRMNTHDASDASAAAVPMASRRMSKRCPIV